MVSISIDWSLAFQIVNFLLMIAILNFLLYRPIRGILQERREKIEGFRSDIEQMTQKAEEQGEEIESRISNARRDGFERKEGIKGQGLEEEGEILDAANQRAAEALQAIKAQIAEEIDSARDALKVDLNIFSKDLAEKILGRSLS